MCVKREVVRGVERLVGTAEAGHVERDGAVRADLADDAPQERGRRPAVQQQHRQVLAQLAMMDSKTVDGDAALLSDQAHAVASGRLHELRGGVGTCLQRGDVAGEPVVGRAEGDRRGRARCRGCGTRTAWGSTPAGSIWTVPGPPRYSAVAQEELHLALDDVFDSLSHGWRWGGPPSRSSLRYSATWTFPPATRSRIVGRVAHGLEGVAVEDPLGHRELHGLLQFAGLHVNVLLSHTSSGGQAQQLPAPVSASRHEASALPKVSVAAKPSSERTGGAPA